VGDPIPTVTGQGPGAVVLRSGQGSTVRRPTYRSGPERIEFDGVDDFMDPDPSGDVTLWDFLHRLDDEGGGGQGTVYALLRLANAASGTRHPIFCTRTLGVNANSRGVAFYIDDTSGANRLRLDLVDGLKRETYSPETVAYDLGATTAWVGVAATWSGVSGEEGMRLYANGAQLGADIAVATTSVGNNATAPRWGLPTSGSDYFAGDVIDWAIYSEALAPATIASLDTAAQVILGGS
jgi:hypothetical protein